MIEPIIKRIFLILTIVFSTNVFGRFYADIGAGATLCNTRSSFSENSSSVLFKPTIPQTSLFSLPNVTWRNRFKNGFDFNALLGYQFDCHWHSSIEFLYQNIRRTSDGQYDWREQNSSTIAIFAEQPNNPVGSAVKRASLYSFLTNFAYDFNPASKWPHFIGIGIGISGLHSKRATTKNSLNINTQINDILTESSPIIGTSPALGGNAFAWQIKAGLRREIFDNILMILQYRFFNTTRFRAGNSVITTNPYTSSEVNFYIPQHSIKGITTNSIELNIRFNLC